MIDPPLAELVELDPPSSQHLLSAYLPTLLRFLRSQESTWIPLATVYPTGERTYVISSWRISSHQDPTTEARVASELLLDGHWKRKSLGSSTWRISTHLSTRPTVVCLSGTPVCNHAFKVNRNHHRPTSDTWVQSRPDSQVGTELDHLDHWRPATGDRHISSPLSLPAIAAPASSPPQIPPFVLFAGPDQHPPPARPCRMNNRLDPVVYVPRRSLGSAVRRSLRNDGQDERSIGFGTQKASHRS